MFKIPTLLLISRTRLILALGAAALGFALFFAPSTTPPVAAPGAGESAHPGLRRPVSFEHRYPVSTERKESPIRIRAVGDVMLGSDFRDEVPDQDVLREVAPMLRSADITLANLEGPLTNATACRKHPDGDESFAFRTPPALARRLRSAGISMASLANNHALDFGEAGRRQTEEALDSLGIGWSGRPGTFAVKNVRGTRVAMVAFAPYAYGNNMLDLDRAGAFIAELSARHDLVVVSMHAGAEGDEALHTPTGAETYQGERRGDARAFARMAVDHGAALVVGHGPHVVRGMEMYKNRLIAYSLGNFATAGQIRRWGHAGAGAMLHAELNRDGTLAQARIISTRQSAAGAPAQDPDQTAARLMRALSFRDFPDTGPGMDANGLVRPDRPARLLALAQADEALLGTPRTAAKVPASPMAKGAASATAKAAARPASTPAAKIAAAPASKSTPGLAASTPAKAGAPLAALAAAKALKPAPAQDKPAATARTPAKAPVTTPVPAAAQAKVQAKAKAPAKIPATVQVKAQAPSESKAAPQAKDRPRPRVLAEGSPAPAAARPNS